MQIKIIQVGRIGGGRAPQGYSKNEFSNYFRKVLSNKKSHIFLIFLNESPNHLPLFGLDGGK